MPSFLENIHERVQQNKQDVASNAEVRKGLKQIYNIGDVFSGHAYFNVGNNLGFGQLSFRLDEATGKFIVDNECRSKEQVAEILHAFIDHVIENMELEDE
jgi:predicted DNA-binding protein